MRRYRRSYQSQLIAIAILAVLLLARWQGWFPDQASHFPGGAPGSSDGAAAAVYEVERVVDGDTLLLRDGHQRVRLQGIDTPETVLEDHPVETWGPEATTYTQKFIRDAGGRVRLEIDGEREDRFERWLRFVWHEDRMLNEELVRAGLARAKLGYDYSQAKKDRLRRAQQEAQRAGRGLWSTPANR
jgi:micrococcal nuclease